MKAQAINYIRQHTEDGQNLSIQTIARYYYINETDGDQWELLEDSGILAIYKDNETEYIDIDHIIAITAEK